MSNVLNMGKDRSFPKEAEIMEKLTELFDSYAGDISVVSAIGILELKKQCIISDANRKLE